MDVVRKLILEKLEELELNMAEVSKRLGRNETYLQQFLKRGSPANSTSATASCLPKSSVFQRINSAALHQYCLKGIR